MGEPGYSRCGEDDPGMLAVFRLGPEVAVAMTSAERIQYGY
jgi:hypothetical protein